MQINLNIFVQRQIHQVISRLASDLSYTCNAFVTDRFGEFSDRDVYGWDHIQFEVSSVGDAIRKLASLIKERIKKLG